MHNILLYQYNLLALFLRTTSFFTFSRWYFQQAGVKTGKNIRVCSSVPKIGDGELSIGGNIFLSAQVLKSWSFQAEVKIGNNVDISPKV